MITTPTGIAIIDCPACHHRHPANRDHCADCGRASVFIAPTTGLCLGCAA